MRIELLGVGGAFSPPEAGHTSALIYGGLNLLLIDCGSRVFDTLRRRDQEDGLDRISHINAVAITHLHDDHVGSLGSLLFYRYYVLGKETEIFCGDQLRPKLQSYLSAVLGDRVFGRPGKDLHLEAPAASGTVYSWGCAEPTPGIHLRPRQVLDAPGEPDYGFTLWEKTGKPESSVFWSGDALFGRFVEDGDPWGFQTDSCAGLLFCDCSFSPRYPQTVHAHLEEYKALPEHIQERIVLVHHNGDVERHKKEIEGTRLQLGVPGAVYAL